MNLFDGRDVFLATTESLGKLNWILDSGYLFYMYLVREHFDIYQSREKGIVNMPNDTQG